MALLVWKHGTTRERAREIVREELRRGGHDGQVTWRGDEASVSVGFGAVLHAAGRITDEAFVLERCGGALGSAVLDRCRALLGRLFPGGEVA